MDMQQQFRAVPDGQYTQTIYSLIRDQKYMEVSLIRYDIIIFSDQLILIFCSHLGDRNSDERAPVLAKEPRRAFPASLLLLLYSGLWQCG